MARLVYRGGPATMVNLTPRVGKDTIGRPGQAPGLSVFDSLERAASPGTKAQVIDLDLLQPPLRGFPDDVALGGSEGQLAIAPATATGEVDLVRLEEWAGWRLSGQVHEFTRLVDLAVVGMEKRPR